nr:MAG: hypothetical protein 2 [Marnaviridae sp.]
MGGAEPSDTVSSTVVEFLDETPGSAWSISNSLSTNLNDLQPEVELAKFLSRPVLINTFTWAQSDSYTTTTNWNPWNLFFNSTPIKNKLNNYAFINCKLKVKFVVNASPFYAGALYFAYSPLQALNGSTIIADSAGLELWPYSQRPGVWVFPQTCSGGEITLPFFYHKNWLDITSSQDTSDMGLFTPCLYAPLTSCNGVTGTSIIINIYAWAEDVKLHAPTTKLALQSDEFDYKPSQIASAVSAAAKKLSRIPIIGPYMKATSVVATKLSNSAAALGFTNVPNMDTVQPYKQYPYPHTSTCDVSIPQDRLVVDPKNEVTIDPRTVGLDGTDELSIAYIAGRETYIGSATLSTSDAVDQLSFAAAVTPGIITTANIADQTKPIQYTACGYVATQFRYWRGDLIYRFKFIATRFHKGRVRITWDPINNISNVVPDYTTVFNEVVDIGAEQDLEIRVPYSQATTFLQSLPSTGLVTMTGSSVPTSTNANGYITMRVVNPLSGPLATASISVLVFVRAADNIEFAVPTNRQQTLTSQTGYSPYALQSAEVQYAIKPRQVIVGNKPTEPDPNRYLVHFGEKITSFRPLLHRMYRQYTIFTPPTATTNTFTIWNHRTGRNIKYQGYRPSSNSYWTAVSSIGGGTQRFNYINNTLLQAISLLFVGKRGSITHMFQIDGSLALPLGASNVSLTRWDGLLSNPSATFFTNNVNSSTNASNQAKVSLDYNADPFSGVALTDQRNQPSISANFPYYSNYNFQFVSSSSADVGSSADNSNVDNINLNLFLPAVAANTNQVINAWSAFGPDFNLFFFINTPSMLSYTLPAAV